MGFEIGQYCTGKVVKGEIGITKNPNGTKAVEAKIEVTRGPNAGQRIHYRGYLTAAGGAPGPKNLETTTRELRAMGWTGTTWGDWSGIGSKEVSFRVMGEEGKNREGRTVIYYRAAFVTEVRTLNRDRFASAEEVADLPPPPSVAAAAPPSTGEDDAEPAGDEIPF